MMMISRESVTLLIFMPKEEVRKAMTMITILILNSTHIHTI